MLSESKGTIKILTIMIHLSLGTKHLSGYQGNNKLILPTLMFSILKLKKICNRFHWHVPHQNTFKHSPYKTYTTQYCLSIMEGTQPTQTLTCLQQSLVEWQISFAPYYSPLNMLSLINCWLSIVTEWFELLLLTQETPSPNLHPRDLLPWLQTIRLYFNPI